MNLLTETKQVLKDNGKTTKDVLWVGDGEYVITWEEFVKIADIKYHAGYGAQEIARDLLIVGKDWWLERYEYDGAEGWEFKTIPLKSNTPKSFKIVKHGMWEHLSTMNGEKK